MRGPCGQLLVVLIKAISTVQGVDTQPNAHLELPSRSAEVTMEGNIWSVYGKLYWCCTSVIIPYMINKIWR